MRVTINTFSHLKELANGTEVCNFNADLCNTGRIIRIEVYGRGHKPKGYVVEFDLPNYGQHLFLGTEHLDEVRENLSQNATK